LLRYPNFSDYISSRRIAKTGRTALDFIEALHDGEDHSFQADEEAFKAYVQEQTGEVVTEILEWSVLYWTGRQRKELFGFNGEDLRPSFQVDRVLQPFQ
jgi:oligopeptidase A